MIDDRTKTKTRPLTRIYPLDLSVGSSHWMAATHRCSQLSLAHSITAAGPAGAAVVSTEHTPRRPPPPRPRLPRAGLTSPAPPVLVVVTARSWIFSPRSDQHTTHFVVDTESPHTAATLPGPLRALTPVGAPLAPLAFSGSRACPFLAQPARHPLLCRYVDVSNDPVADLNLV